MEALQGETNCFQVVLCQNRQTGPPSANRPFYSQARYGHAFFHPAGKPTHLPVPPFLLMQNLPLKDIAGSDITIAESLMTPYNMASLFSLNNNTVM